MMKKLARKKHVNSCMVLFTLSICLALSSTAQDSVFRETIGEATKRYLMASNEYAAMEAYYNNKKRVGGEAWIHTEPARRISAILTLMRNVAVGTTLIDSSGKTFIVFIDTDKYRRIIEVSSNMNKKEIFYYAQQIANLIISDLKRFNKVFPPSIKSETKQLLDQAVGYAGKGEYEKALIILNEARKQSDASSEIYFDLALTESKFPNRELRAMAWYGAYLRANPYSEIIGRIKNEISHLDSSLCRNINLLLNSLFVAAKAIKNEQRGENFRDLVLLNCKQGNLEVADNILRYMQQSGEQSFIPALDSTMQIISNYKNVIKKEMSHSASLEDYATVWKWTNMLTDENTGNQAPLYLTSFIFRDLPHFLRDAGTINDQQGLYTYLKNGILQLITARAKVLDMISLQEGEWNIKD